MTTLEGSARNKAIEDNNFPIQAVRSEFPALIDKKSGKQIVYLDSAASALKPQCVIDEIAEFYATDYSNVHRSSHSLGEKATARYEGARCFVQKTIGAKSRNEIVFTRNATEAINLVASSWGNAFFEKQSENKKVIAISAMEHHSNLIPWQLLTQRKNCKIVKIPINEKGEIDTELYLKILEKQNVAIVAIAHISNVLGTVNPIKKLIAQAHAHGSLVLVDGSQGVPHEQVNVGDINADFYVFTGHKVYGPSGIGVLYAKEKLLEDMPPYQGGGEMVSRVEFEKSTWNELPWKFEAGTPPIAQAVGLEAALRFMQRIGLETIKKHEEALCNAMLEKLGKVKSLRLLGNSQRRAPIFSFAIENTNAFDVATLLDKQGICCRAGLHCAEPLIRGFGLPGCVRATFAIYNSESEGEQLIDALRKAQQMLC